jgi:hypothetical protein
MQQFNLTTQISVPKCIYVQQDVNKVKITEISHRRERKLQ